MRFPAFSIVFTAALALMLPACSPKVEPGTEHPPVEAAWMSVKESSYSAADTLLDQNPKDIRPDMPALVGTVTDINRVGTSTALGRMISEQLGARFAMRGYDVREIKMRNNIKVDDGRPWNTAGAGEYVISREPGVLDPSMISGYLVSGTYAVGRNRVHVSLRVLDSASGKLLAGHDYALVMTPDIRALTSDDSRRYQIFDGRWPD